MKTPIYDFVSRYVEQSPVRMHMPGHKGGAYLGCEARDITEIPGADVLSSPDSIILESENNATALFGTAHSFYSTEGSSQCIRAMLSLVAATARITTARKILAARNVHKSMIYACALLDLEVDWLLPESSSTSICSCPITKDTVKAALEASAEHPLAVYLTSPDYLGQMADVRAIADVCHAFDVPLLVDNAHGAYLHFLEESLHPIAQGADLCCDSAHKTLPVLTGGAYLHVSKQASKDYLSAARSHLALFGSTSPSYLILQSLDLCNRHLAENLPSKLRHVAQQTATTKKTLLSLGYSVLPSEPLKLVLCPLSYGYTGEKFASLLRQRHIECEFFDREHLVLMMSADTADQELEALCTTCREIPRQAARNAESLIIPSPHPLLSLRDAVLAPAEEIAVADAEGRICAAPTVSCPPAIPIAVSGEKITKAHMALFLHYGIARISVIKATVPKGTT